MKKASRRDQARAAARQPSPETHQQKGNVGRWAFNLASESLFPLGSTEGSRRVAYRMADGQLRFLPL